MSPCSQCLTFESLFGQVGMHHYSGARGRKKEVEKFTPKHGLRMLALLMLFAMVLGVLRVDVD